MSLLCWFQVGTGSNIWGRARKHVPLLFPFRWRWQMIQIGTGSKMLMWFVGFLGWPQSLPESLWLRIQQKGWTAISQAPTKHWASGWGRALASAWASVSTQLCLFRGFPSGNCGKEPACQCRRRKRCGFHPWVRKILWRRKWQPPPVFLPGEPHGQGSLVGYGPWGHKESDSTEMT